MMSVVHQHLPILRDRRGSTAIEFAILGPTLIIMLLGVLMIGMQMQSYNSLRSIGYDVNRYTVVEYQKENTLSAGQIQQIAASIAGRSPYNISRERLTTTVTEEATGISGAKKFELTLTYTPAEINALLDVSAPKLTQTQSIIVPN